MPNLYAIRNRRASILACNAPAARKDLTLDSYIIRIYRRGIERGQELAGLVEQVGNGKRQAFGNSEELWGFLTERHPSPRNRAKARQRSKAQP